MLLLTTIFVVSCLATAVADTITPVKGNRRGITLTRCFVEPTSEPSTLGSGVTMGDHNLTANALGDHVGTTFFDSATVASREVSPGQMKRVLMTEISLEALDNGNANPSVTLIPHFTGRNFAPSLSIEKTATNRFTVTYCEDSSDCHDFVYSKLPLPYVPFGIHILP